MAKKNTISADFESFMDAEYTLRENLQTIEDFQSQLPIVAALAEKSGNLGIKLAVEQVMEELRMAEQDEVTVCIKPHRALRMMFSGVSEDDYKDLLAELCADNAQGDPKVTPLFK